MSKNKGNKQAVQAQEPKAQEPEAPAQEPEMPGLAKLEAMLGQIATGQEGINARLAKLEEAPAAPAKAAVKAKATPKITIPHTAELGTLKGICKPVAQAIVEANYRKGKAVMGEYCAKLADFQTNPEKPSPRYAYAKALYATMG